jgi:hypothetical protein
VSLPTFLIIGAAKAGTTTLYRYCQRHPEVFASSVKEPRFFAFEGEEFGADNPVHAQTVTDWENYQALFQNVGDEIAIGEASPSYLSRSEKAAPRIKHYLPDARIVAILRNPVDRAYSHFLYAVQKGLEPPDATFDEALFHPTVSVGNWVRNRPYIHMGYYGRQLSEYFALFPKDQIRVFLFEDLIADESKLAKDFFGFIGVDSSFDPVVGVKTAKSGLPRNRAIHNILNRPNPIKGLFRPFLSKKLRLRLTSSLNDYNLVKPSISPTARNHLVELYREDILRLQELLDRDLSHWLQ